MPCSCGHKVDRSQPKIQCAKCNELFHMSCVGIQPADVEFLLNSDKSFYCKVCANARRNSIRSPPPPVGLDDRATNNSIVTKSGLSTNPTSKSLITAKHCDNNTNEPNNKQEQISLGSLYNVIVSLRAENVHMLNMICALREDNKHLINKTDSMHSDLLSLQRTLQEKDEAIALLKSEFNDLRSCVNAAVEKLGGYCKPNIGASTSNCHLPTLQISPDACSLTANALSSAANSSTSVNSLPVNMQSPAVDDDVLSSACSLPVSTNALSSAAKSFTTVDVLLSSMQSPAVDNNGVLSSVNFPALPGACVGVATVSSLESKKSTYSPQHLMPSADSETTTTSPQLNAKNLNGSLYRTENTKIKMGCVLLALTRTLNSKLLCRLGGFI